MIIGWQVDSSAAELLRQLQSTLSDRLHAETCAARLRIQLEFLSDTSDRDLVRRCGSVVD